MNGFGCADRVEAIALPGLPIISPGDDLAPMIARGMTNALLTWQDGDVVVIASTLVARAEGQFVDVGSLDPSARAHELAEQTGHDPRHVELILRESIAVSRAARGVLIMRQRLGVVVANAGVDFSNAEPPAELAARGRGPWALCLPRNPDATAQRLRSALTSNHLIGVVISDSFGRPFRHGSVGVAIGAAGVPGLRDHRGQRDLFGRSLEHTVTALADQIASIADLVAGQADERRGAVLVRGLRFPPTDGEGAAVILRPIATDLYA